MTRYFAESLGRKCTYRVVEASDGEAVEPRTAYVAPGGRHMVLRKQGDRVSIALNDQPPENGCRPSVDVFFRSVADAYPRSVIAVVLTGMGTDGAKGLGPLKRSGAYVIAQDEATSVVWGMPGAAVATSQVDEVLPLEGDRPDGRLAAGGRDLPMRLSPDTFDDIRKAVHDLCGVVIAEDKQYLVVSRLEPILKRNGLPSYESLVQGLKQPNSLAPAGADHRGHHDQGDLVQSRRPPLRGTPPVDPPRTREPAAREAGRDEAPQAEVLASGVRPWRRARKPTAWRWPCRTSWRAGRVSA